MQELTRGANCPAPSATVTVSVNCASAVDVSALLLAADGKVRSDDDFVFYNNPAGPGVTYLPAGTAPHGVDAVRVETAVLPPGIEKIVVTASLDGSGPETFAAAGSMVVTVLDGESVDAVSYDITDLASEKALICVEVYLRNGQWKIRAVGQGYDSGLAGIATDFGITVEDDEPAAPAVAAQSPPPSVAAPPPPPVAVPLPPLVPPAPDAPWAPSAPLAPAPALPPLVAPPLMPPPAYPPLANASPAGQHSGTPKVNLDKGRVSLLKNQSVSLVKTGAPPLSMVAMGLGWDPARRGRNIDLDASVIAFDGAGKELESVWFMHKQAFGGAIRHSGDNLTGAGDGDDEVINVDLSKLPGNVVSLVFTVTSFGGQKFTAIAKAYCRLLDRTSGRHGTELVRFELTDTQASTGALMCKLVREPNATWTMTSIGTFHDGRSVKKLRGPAKAAL